MNVDDLKEILDLVREHDLSEFELEREGLKLKVKKSGAWTAVPSSAFAQPLPAVALPAQPVSAPQAAQPAARPSVDAAAGEAVDLAVVKSPIVGTFYRAPEPGAPPFVESGGQVKKGQVLCIIEAMKLMNEIESDYEGEIITIYVENGQPVQYGERLFAIRVK